MQFTTNSLFTRCIQTNDFNKLLIIPEQMWNANEKKYVEYIRTFLTNYKRFPTWELFLDNNPAFRIDETDRDVPTDFLFDTISTHLSQNYIKRKISEDASAGINVYNSDYLRDLSNKSRIPPKEMLQYNFIDTATYKKKIVKYNYGNYTIDQLTNGLLSSDFTFITARMKTGKTFFMNLLQILLFKQGIRTLTFSNEINLMQYAGRMDSMLGKFNPLVFRTLEFDSVQKQLEKAQQERMNSKTPLYLFGPLRNIHDLVTTVQVFDEEVRPQVIFIDSYNLTSKRGSTSDEKSLDITNTNAFARDFINDYGIPLICTIQTNRSGAGADNVSTDQIAMSDDFARICDQMFGLSPAELSGGLKATKINTVVSRATDPEPLYYTVDWNNMEFSFYKTKDELQPKIDFEKE